jgi:hypothetical protein
MRAPLYIALIALTACGGNKKSDTTPVDNDDTPTKIEDDAVSDGDTDGAKEEEPPPPPPEPPRPPDLAGSWVGPCSPTAADPKINGIFTFTFTADAWTLDMERFADAACTKRTFAIQQTGTYEIGEMSAAAEGAWDADITVTSFTLTADDKATAKKLAKACGVKLKAKKALDLSAKGCAKLLLRPVADCGHMYDVVAMKAGQLYFGAHPPDNDTCTVEKRPAALADHGMQMRWKASGLANCDAYAAKVQEYIACDKVPEQAKEGALDGLRAMSAGFSDMSSVPEDAKKQANDACQQAVDALQQGMTAMGC